MNSETKIPQASFWTTEEKVFMAPLSLITFLEDDVYSPIAIAEDEALLEDIKINGQTTNAFLTEDNVCIGGRRICKILKAIGSTHVKAQRVKIEPRYRTLFLFATNKYRFKTLLEKNREVEIIYNTLPRNQGKKEIVPPKPAAPITQMPTPVTTGQPTATIETPISLPTPPTVTPVQPQVTLPVARAPIKTTISLPAPEPPKEKPKTPIEKAIEIADNGTKSSEFQRYQYIKRIDEKYGTKLLQMLATKCPNVDKIYKAAQVVAERNKFKSKPEPALVVATSSLPKNLNLYNKSNWKMDEVKNGSIDFSLTSHPYWKQIDYNEANPNQMGQEATVSEFIKNLVKTYTEVYKKFAPAGNLFVNMKGTFDKKANHLVEQHFIIAMCAIGWHYEDTFIWLKKGGGKRSGDKTRRPENSYEPIFWFTKTSDYYYKPIEIPTKKDITVTFKAAETRIESKGVTCYDKIDVSLPFTSFKNVIKETEFLDVVVTNSAATDSQFMNDLYGKHPAPFPMALPLLFLLQFCPENGRCLEPFLGRGAALVSALMLGHTVYGYEIEQEYFEAGKKLLIDVQKDIEYYGEQMKELQLAFQQKFNNDEADDIAA